jgi:hypothetical protein
MAVYHNFRVSKSGKLVCDKLRHAIIGNSARDISRVVVVAEPTESGAWHFKAGQVHEAVIQAAQTYLTSGEPVATTTADHHGSSSRVDAI